MHATPSPHLVAVDVGHHARVALEVAAHVDGEDEEDATLLPEALVQFLLIVLLHDRSQRATSSYEGTGGRQAGSRPLERCQPCQVSACALHGLQPLIGSNSSAESTLIQEVANQQGMSGPPAESSVAQPRMGMSYEVHLVEPI